MINQPIPILNDGEDSVGHLEEMHPELARRTVNWYVCSRCWSELTLRETDQGAFVECVLCGEETYGYVTRKWTDTKRSSDHYDAMEVTKMLQRIGVLPAPEKRSTAQLLHELGY